MHTVKSDAKRVSMRILSFITEGCPWSHQSTRGGRMQQRAHVSHTDAVLFVFSFFSPPSSTYVGFFQVSVLISFQTNFNTREWIFVWGQIWDICDWIIDVFCLPSTRAFPRRKVWTKFFLMFRVTRFLHRCTPSFFFFCGSLKFCSFDAMFEWRWNDAWRCAPSSGLFIFNRRITVKYMLERESEDCLHLQSKKKKQQSVPCVPNQISQCCVFQQHHLITAAFRKYNFSP